MSKLGVIDGALTTYLRVDVNQPGGPDKITTIQDGPIVSRLDANMEGMPEGTLLYGYLWTGSELIFGHYDRAKLPNGDIIPVCIALGVDSDKQGLLKLWGSKAPGTVEIARRVPALMVERFQ